MPPSITIEKFGRYPLKEQRDRARRLRKLFKLVTSAEIITATQCLTDPNLHL